jgi:hypothetical protein
VVGSLYILSAKLSLSLLTPEGVAVFWPAAGVAAGVLIAFGPPARWGVVVGTMVGTIVVNLLGDRNLWSSIVFALCNAGEAVLTAWLIERYFGSPFNLDRLRHVLGLLGAAIVATAISGIGGTLGFVLFAHNGFFPHCLTVPRLRRVEVDAIHRCALARLLRKGLYICVLRPTLLKVISLCLSSARRASISAARKGIRTAILRSSTLFTMRTSRLASTTPPTR